MNYPQSMESEKVVIASLMQYGLNVVESCHRLRPEMFSTDVHRRVFSVALELIEDGTHPDFQAVAEKLGKTLLSLGGMSVLLDLDDGLNALKDPSFHVATVIEKWKLRQGMRICERYLSQFGENDADTTLSMMQSEVFDALQENASSQDPRIAAMTVPALDRILDYSKPAMGLSYGHVRLNEFTMGMQPGQVSVVGARSGVGKSALMVQSAYASARQGIPVSLFSLEMGRDEVQMRLWSMDSGVPYYKIQRKLCNDSERRAVREAAMRLGDMPLRIYDDGEMTLSQIAATARLDARRNGVQLVAVDYVQNVNGDAKEDDRLRVARVSRTMTKLAKAEKIHVMLLSQLRKMPVEQYGRPPHIGDLAETRQLENDCHVCLLLHRGWDENASRISNEGEILIPKQRNGGTGVLPTTFNFEELRYE